MGMQRGQAAPTFYSAARILLRYHFWKSWSTQIDVYFFVLIIVQPKMFYRILITFYQVIYTLSRGHIHPFSWGWMWPRSRVNSIIISAIYWRNIVLYLFIYDLEIICNIRHIPYPNLPHMFFPWMNPSHSVTRTYFSVSPPYWISYTVFCVQIAMNSGSCFVCYRTQIMYLLLSLQHQHLQTSPGKEHCNKSNVQGFVHRKYIPFDTFPTRCNITQFIYIWKLLYMFHVESAPIVRSTYNCIYRIWYLSNRYCYLPR